MGTCFRTWSLGTKGIWDLGTRGKLGLQPHPGPCRGLRMPCYFFYARYLRGCF
jgi:hypothetical protein